MPGCYPVKNISGTEVLQSCSINGVSSNMREAASAALLSCQETKSMEVEPCMAVATTFMQTWGTSKEVIQALKESATKEISEAIARAIEKNEHDPKVVQFLRGFLSVVIQEIQDTYALLESLANISPEDVLYVMQRSWELTKLAISTVKEVGLENVKVFIELVQESIILDDVLKSIIGPAQSVISRAIESADDNYLHGQAVAVMIMLGKEVIENLVKEMLRGNPVVLATAGASGNTPTNFREGTTQLFTKVEDTLKSSKEKTLVKSGKKINVGWINKPWKKGYLQGIENDLRKDVFKNFEGRRISELSIEEKDLVKDRIVKQMHQQDILNGQFFKDKKLDDAKIWEAVNAMALKNRGYNVKWIAASTKNTTPEFEVYYKGKKLFVESKRMISHTLDRTVEIALDDGGFGKRVNMPDTKTSMQIMVDASTAKFSKQDIIKELNKQSKHSNPNYKQYLNKGDRILYTNDSGVFEVEYQGAGKWLEL